MRYHARVSSSLTIADVERVAALAQLELTAEEKNRLKGQIQTLLQKGDFMSDEFVEEVKALIR